MENVTVRIDVEPGPVCRAALDVLDLLEEMADSLETHPKAAELVSRINTLSETLCNHLKTPEVREQHNG